MRFLEAFDCTILEKTPSYVTVKLSSEADREMTGRPYYWSFIERTGTAAETMTYTFVFDPEQMKLAAKPKSATAVKSPPPAGPGPTGNGGTPGQSAERTPDSILGRYF